MLSTTFINTSWQNDYPDILHLTKEEPVLESSSVPIQTSFGIMFKVQCNLVHSSALFSITKCWHEKEKNTREPVHVL